MESLNKRILRRNCLCRVEIPFPEVDSVTSAGRAPGIGAARLDANVLIMVTNLELHVEAVNIRDTRPGIRSSPDYARVRMQDGACEMYIEGRIRHACHWWRLCGGVSNEVFRKGPGRKKRARAPEKLVPNKFRSAALAGVVGLRFPYASYELCGKDMYLAGAESVGGQSNGNNEAIVAAARRYVPEMVWYL
ncbi:hypothetical protein WN55_01057 [Dufourea novaeangliae]|uniref:Uncharacterized protein n=1 Tax=Dufourea novaeangliae TaxID=178035 RepID=A0A154PF55_DUFNO|nr:hypothetical protein WN55_01057 [Dufourea novaeangliae]